MTKENLKEEIEQLIFDLKSAELDTRQEATYRLNQLSEKATQHLKLAVPALKKSMNDPNWAVSKMSILASGNLIVTSEIPKIIEKLNNDEESEVRVGAAEALGKMRSTDSIESLIKALDDSYKMLGLVAVWSLGTIGNKAAEAVPRIVEYLLEEESNGIIQPKQIAAWALGEIGDKSAIEPLKQSLTEVSGNERNTIQEALDILERNE
jgi:HEAT repeat protein